MATLKKTKNKTIKLPPQNIEAEISVLGSLMIDQSAIAKVADILAPEDFYYPKHQKIFQAALDLYRLSEPIDQITLTARLKELGIFKEVGGASYLASLVEEVPTSLHIENYAKIVRKKRILRDLIDVAAKIMSLGYNESEEIENIVEEAEKMVFAISQKSTQKDFIDIEKLLKEAFERIDRIHSGGDVLRGIPTGFADLDNLLAGLQKSDMIILASRPSFGKTTIALDIARNVSIHHKIPVAIFSLEMSKDQLVDRLLASEANVSLWKLRTGKLSLKGENNDFMKLQSAFGALSQASIYIDDSGANTITQMRAMARRLQAEKNIGLIIIDYLQLMRSAQKIDNRVQEISDISRSIKLMARELDLPIIAISQLSRAVEHRHDFRPRLSDLRESGSLEQDADVVMFIHREDKYKKEPAEKNIAEIIIAKHRNGPTGEVKLYFNEQSVRFENLARQYQQDEPLTEIEPPYEFEELSP